jgi:hypothetical protein
MGYNIKNLGKIPAYFKEKKFYPQLLVLLNLASCCCSIRKYKTKTLMKNLGVSSTPTK